MEAMMIDKIQILMAGLAALSLGAFVPLPLHADDNSLSWMSADEVRTGPPRLSPRLRPDPRRTQIADSAQSTNSESSASASASSSASVTVTGGQKQGKCSAEATAHAKANSVEDSDHDMKVVQGDGCSAKAESSATVKPQRE